MKMSDMLADEDGEEDDDDAEALLLRGEDGDVFDLMERGDAAFAMEVEDEAAIIIPGCTAAAAASITTIL